MAVMHRYKLIDLNDQETLSRFMPSFPCSFERLLQTVTQVFADKQLKLLDSYFDDCQEQLENSTTFLNQVDFLKTLKGELVQLSKLMDGLQDKTLEAEKNTKELHKQFRGISEDNQGFVWDTIYEINIHALKHPSHYLKEQAAAIRHEFSR